MLCQAHSLTYKSFTNNIEAELIKPLVPTPTYQKYKQYRGTS